MGVQSLSPQGKFLIEGTAGSGKTTLLLERYSYMIRELGIPAGAVLVLLSSPSRLQAWKDSCSFELAEGLKCHTYHSFIQEELTVFYPLVTGDCQEIGQKEIKPVFMGAEPSRFLVSKAVQLRRERNGAFAGLTSTNDRIASELIGNLLLSAVQDISPDEIGSRLTHSLEKASPEKATMLSEADAIMSSFRNKCLELGVFDIGESIRLFHRILLKNDTYRQILMKRFRYILVDDLQEWNLSQLRLLSMLEDTAGACIYTVNPGLAEDPLKLHIREFLRDFCIDGCEKIELEGSHTCSKDLFQFSELLLRRLVNTEEEVSGSPIIQQAFLEMHPPAELRNDMLQQLGERVVSLIKADGYKPSDIVILSTYADSVTERVLSHILQENGVRLNNLSRRETIADSPLCRALLTFAQLCHPGCRLFPSRDDINEMCSCLFSLDPVRCSILASKTINAVPFPKLPDDGWPELEQVLGGENREKYDYVRHWMEEYQQSPQAAGPGEFFHRALLEVFLTEKTALEDALQARKMIGVAAKFIEAVSRFNRNGIKDFIEMARTQAMMPENREEREERLGGDWVLLTTPALFLSNALRCKVLVFCSLSSNNWLPGIVKELSNPYVLNDSWPQDGVYNGTLDEANRKEKLARSLGSILKACSEKLVTFESGLSANGYSNDGILPGLFDLTRR